MSQPENTIESLSVALAAANDTIALLREGDPCARQCECTAFRAEVVTLKQEIQRLSEKVKGWIAYSEDAQQTIQRLNMELDNERKSRNQR
jgi:outer membrane murein-binding lipoprotein Lpp